MRAARPGETQGRRRPTSPASGGQYGGLFAFQRESFRSPRGTTGRSAPLLSRDEWRRPARNAWGGDDSRQPPLSDRLTSPPLTVPSPAREEKRGASLPSPGTACRRRRARTGRRRRRLGVMVSGCELGLHDCTPTRYYILHVTESHMLARLARCQEHECLLGQSEPKELYLLRTSNSQNT
jgi:hypothetical protein